MGRSRCLACLYLLVQSETSVSFYNISCQTTHMDDSHHAVICTKQMICFNQLKLHRALVFSTLLVHLVCAVLRQSRITERVSHLTPTEAFKRNKIRFIKKKNA